MKLEAVLTDGACDTTAAEAKMSLAARHSALRVESMAGRDAAFADGPQPDAHPQLPNAVADPATAALESELAVVSAAFDTAFYLQQTDDPAAQAAPVLHYVAQGWRLGLDPAAGFSTRFYLARNEDVRRGGGNPFYHYLLFGRHEGRAPHPDSGAAGTGAPKLDVRLGRVQLLGGAPDQDVDGVVRAEFDAAFYHRQQPDLAPEEDPVDHYIARGWRLGLDPAPGFSTLFYLESNEDVRRSGTNPFYHYLTFGRDEGRAPSRGKKGVRRTALAAADEVYGTVGAAFDCDFYFGAHPTLDHRTIDPVQHYLTQGSALGWDPAPDFSTRFYLRRSADVRRAGVNPFYHYLTCGREEGRAGSPAALAAGPPVAGAAARLIAPAFDAAFYMRSHPDLAANHVEPLLHYLHSGWRLGYDPSADFSTAFYLERSPDVRAAGENPLHHYLRIGRREGRLPSWPAGVVPHAAPDFLEGALVEATVKSLFDAAYYRARYTDIVANRLDPLPHYLISGWKERRDPAPWFSTAHYLDRYPGVEAIGMNPLFHYAVWGRDQGFGTGTTERGGMPVKRVADAALVPGQDLRVLLRRPEPQEAAASASAPMRRPPADPDRLDIHWVVPDFDIGGGGHMTIFRMVKWLELFGHTCTIWVAPTTLDHTDAEREEIVLRHYQTLRARVHTLGEATRFGDADALIATGWDTAYLVRAAADVRAKYYFVQDYEPYFHAVGARSLAARQTYGFGLTCLCASAWLQRLMCEHGAEAHAFALAADESYAPPDLRPRNAIPRIAFYAREHTTRRAVELGLLALEVLAASGARFHVDFFGRDAAFAEAPFSATHWGILDAASLARLYGEADLGLCFSATNYSLVPQEMMACGLPVVELDTESTREAFPPGVVAMVSPDPHAIAEALGRLLQDSSARDALAQRGAEWVGTLSWEKSARAIEMVLRGGAPGAPQPRPSRRAKPARSTAATAAPRASVVIPTRNGGELFRRVLARVLQQRAPWAFDVVVVDTESGDGTWEHVTAEAAGQGDRLCARRIARQEFQHGRTRNLGAGMGRGEYIAFLTQDALPDGPFWLYNMVTLLDRFPRAAAAFGPHRAWPDASPFTRRDIAAHFAQFAREPLSVSRYTDFTRWRREDVAFRRFLHFFSDNSSCLRRSVWERLPYPEVDYGEDQLWASQIIERGYGKLFAPDSVVFHSHEYDEMQTFERARTEACFFRTHFDYDFSHPNLAADLMRVNAEDECWGVRNGATPEQIARQKRLNVHRLTGWAAGAIEGVSFPSAF